MMKRFGIAPIASTVVAALALASTLAIAAAPAAGAATSADDAGRSLAWVESAPVLAIGSSGPAVSEWQDAMNRWLEVAAPADAYRLRVDGVYGSMTDAVTRSFQAAQGLPVDGLVGPVTRAGYLSAPELVDAGAGPAANVPVLAPGASGESVVMWQHALNVWLEASRAVGEPLVTDGEFGPATEAATLAFQSSQGVTVDGLVGPETWAALLSAPSLVNAAPTPRNASTPTPTNPAAGICAHSETAIVDVTLLTDVASPRCVDLTGELRWLRIRNDGPATHVSLGSLALDLAPGETVTTELPVRAYVDLGAHVLVVSRYGDTGPDIWVRS